jgi:hypothetical protein
LEVPFALAADCGRMTSYSELSARRIVISGMPTIRELTSPVNTSRQEGSNGVECGGWSTQRPANTPYPRRTKASAL